MVSPLHGTQMTRLPLDRASSWAFWRALSGDPSRRWKSARVRSSSRDWRWLPETSKIRVKLLNSASARARAATTVDLPACPAAVEQQPRVALLEHADLPGIGLEAEGHHQARGRRARGGHGSSRLFW